MFDVPPARVRFNSGTPDMPKGPGIQIVDRDFKTALNLNSEMPKYEVRKQITETTQKSVLLDRLSKVVWSTYKFFNPCVLMRASGQF